MIWAGKSGDVRRGVALTLTVLALLLKVAVPPGFMVADTGAPLPIAICTGHGPLILHPDHGKTPTAPAHKTEAPCTGAGTVTPPVPPLAGVQPEAFVWTATMLQPARAFGITPGRGLAAPPPPSHAPPARLS